MTTETQAKRQRKSRIIISVIGAIVLVITGLSLYAAQRSNHQRANAELAFLSLEAAVGAARSENREEGERLDKCLKAAMVNRRTCDAAEMSERFALWQTKLPNLSASVLADDFCSRLARATASADSEARAKSEPLQRMCRR